MPCLINITAVSVFSSDMASPLSVMLGRRNFIPVSGELGTVTVETAEAITGAGALGQFEGLGMSR
jgi:hypothetical protein